MSDDDNAKKVKAGAKVCSSIPVFTLRILCLLACNLSFIHSLVRWLVRPYTYSFIHAYIHSFFDCSLFLRGFSMYLFFFNLFAICEML